MYTKLTECPTLFIGYGFHDSGVEKVIARILEKRKQDIWIQCMPDNENIQLYRDLGCYVVEADTEGLLEWIKSNLGENVAEHTILKIPNTNFPIPEISTVPVVSSKEFYSNAETHWYNIMFDHAYERTYVNDILELHLAHKNVVFIGMPFSGKTTMLMQLALKSSSKIKMFVNDLTSEKAKNIINNLGTDNATVFIDDFAEDILAYELLASSPKIETIAGSDDFIFESSKHLISKIA